MKNAITSTFVKLAALTAITTAGCTAEDISTGTTSSADASSGSDSGKLRGMAKDVSGDVSSALSEVASPEVAPKKCGKVTVDYDFPSTCIDGDFDNNGKPIGFPKFQTIVKFSPGEKVSPVAMYVSKGSSMIMDLQGDHTVSCIDNPTTTEMDVRLALGYVEFADLKNGDTFKIGIQSGENCGFKETYFVFVNASEMGGGDGGEYRKTADGSVGKPFMAQVCDGKGIQIFPEGVTCK